MIAPITINDVLRLALPPGTRVAAGAQGLQRQATWVVTPRATLPAFANLRGGEVALVSLAALAALDPRLTLASLVERLAAVPISAIGVIGAASPAACAAAEQARMPLLELPAEADLRETEREVQRLIGDYEAQIERRAAQLGGLLTQRALAGAGVPGLIELLAERTGRAVACYSAGGDLRSLKGRGAARVALQTLRPAEAGATSQLGQAVWVQPLGARQLAERPAGFLVLAGEALDAWDQQAAQQGAIAIALELAKEQAVLAAEERLRGDFVQTLLAGPPADSEALLQRGQELGYDLRGPYVALLCALADADDGTGARLTEALADALAALGVSAPTMRRADGVLCYLPLLGRNQRPRELAEQLRARLLAEVPQVVLALGTEAATLSAWARSLREAEQALLLGRHLLDSGQVLDFGDLGVYRLLLLLREAPELWDFYRDTLAALTDYDRRQHAELLKTLEAFFANLGNLARAADALHVHRNTLLYRLERISEISGRSIDNAEDRLALWLALKAHRVLQTLDGDVG